MQNDKGNSLNEEKNPSTVSDESPLDALASNPHRVPWRVDKWHLLNVDGDDVFCDSAAMNFACNATYFHAALTARVVRLEKAVTAASHALKSYAHGNADTDLAEEVAAFCDAAIASSHPSV